MTEHEKKSVSDSSLLRKPDIAVENDAMPQSVVSQRPQRERVVPCRFFDFEMHCDGLVDDEGDLVHMALMAGA